VTRATYVVLPVVTAVVVGGCGRMGSRTFRDQPSGITVHYPAGWSVTGFSRTVSPPRIVLASYKITPRDVEGDCGGRRALTALPDEGAAVLLIDYGPARDAAHTRGLAFPPRPKQFLLGRFARGDYECFGNSYMLRFAAAGHGFEAYLWLGEHASRAARKELLRILDSLTGEERS
jgi:hypothetical protein